MTRRALLQAIGLMQTRNPSPIRVTAPAAGPQVNPDQINWEANTPQPAPVTTVEPDGVTIIAVPAAGNPNLMRLVATNPRIIPPTRVLVTTDASGITTWSIQATRRVDYDTEGIPVLPVAGAAADDHVKEYGADSWATSTDPTGQRSMFVPVSTPSGWIWARLPLLTQ